MAHFVLGGGQEKIFALKTLVFFCTPKKYMKNICCYYFSSQHDAFWFFLTFLTLKNNLKRLNTKRQKIALLSRRFCTEFVLGGQEKIWPFFLGGAGSHGFTGRTAANFKYFLTREKPGESWDVLFSNSEQKKNSSACKSFAWKNNSKFCPQNGKNSKTRLWL